MEQEEEVIAPCLRGTLPSKSRCMYCYRRERMKDRFATSIEIKRRCVNPTNGCVVCKKYICGPCFPIHVEEVRQNRAYRGTKRPRPKSDFDNARSGSAVMESLVTTNGTSWKDFLETDWEQKSRLFTYSADITPWSKRPTDPVSKSSASSISSVSGSASASVSASASGSAYASASASTPIAPNRQTNPVSSKIAGDGCWREASMDIFPLRETIRQSWHILITLMDVGKTVDGKMADHIGKYCHNRMVKVSVFQNFQSKTRDEILGLYAGDIHTAYLWGCSIVWENCDMVSPHIAALCQDLQGGGAFAQAYSTAHLTPSQYCDYETSPPNTNEYNIFVIQLVGRKHWNTFWNTPQDSAYKPKTTIPPSSGEPSSEISPSFDGYLCPGDILYIPKGMSYQTHSKEDGECDPSMSFHVTVTLGSPDASKFGKEKSTVVSRPPTFPESRSTSTDTINIVMGPGEQDLKHSIYKDYSIALSQKRTSLIEEAKRTSLSGKRSPTKREGNSQGSKPVDVSSVGPRAASKVTFLTEVRAVSKRERRRKITNTATDNVDGTLKWNTGIRYELSAVAKAIGMRLLLLAPEGEAASPNAYAHGARVVDVCEIVKNSFEDKSDISRVCGLTMLVLVRREVEAGNLAVVLRSASGTHK